MKQMKETPKKPEAFVASVISRINGAGERKPNMGLKAALRRADNPDTEYQSWEHLAPWCDLESARERLPYATVAASLARADAGRDGTLGIGRAIAKSYEEKGKIGHEQDSAKAKIRRLLACKSGIEACEVLRPILRLIGSRGVSISHSRLLADLLYFGEKTRQRWAMDFYSKKEMT